MIANLKITTMSVFHIVVFFASIVFVYTFRNSTLISMFAAELIILYVAAVNLRRREILPALAICLAFKLLEYPISLWQFNNVISYLLLLIAFDSALLYALSRHYRSPKLWELFKVDVPPLPIPQVKALCTLIAVGIFHLTLVTTEVVLHLTGMVAFDEIPFFYRTYPEARATHKVIFMIGVWSMMLDAHYHPARLAKK